MKKRMDKRPKVSKAQIDSVLREHFHIRKLRPGQQSVIESVLQGQDTLAIMPAGAGKSLCFQLPALLLPGMVVVVSPLIALMQDQVDKLDKAGIAAEQVNSGLNGRDEEAALHNIEQSQAKIVYATPERMSDSEFIASLQQARVDLFVIDEAHCISQWGHDFRPAYLELGNAINALGKPPVLALTATATAEVKGDIKQQLGVHDMQVINTGIYRPNFHYRVIQITSDEQKLAETLRLVSETQGNGIIYTATVKAAESLHESLLQHGEQVALYHGKLPAADRRRNQESFMRGECRLMVATNAFGMGIDKNDVRFIVHYQMPANLESYYQESGRAGRDGQEACCTLLFDRKDKRVQQFFLVKHYPDTQELQAVHNAVLQLAASGESANIANIKALLPELAQSSAQIAVSLLKQSGVLAQNRKFAFRAREQALTPVMLDRMAHAYEEKQESDRQALEALVNYAQSGSCRWRILLDYFDDDEGPAKCGKCDNCLHPPELLLAEDKDEAETDDRPVVEKPEEIVIGSEARVHKYGKGKITEVVGDQITIDLAKVGPKTFLRRYVRIL